MYSNGNVNFNYSSNFSNSYRNGFHGANLSKYSYGFGTSNRFMNFTSSSNFTVSSFLNPYFQSNSAQTNFTIGSDLTTICKNHEIDNFFSALPVKEMLKQEVFNIIGWFKNSKLYSSASASERRTLTQYESKNNSLSADFYKLSPEYYDEVFENELQILALTQSDYVPNVVECYLNMKMENTNI